MPAACSTAFWRASFAWAIVGGGAWTVRSRRASSAESAAALATIPAPGRSGAQGDPAFEAVTAEEAEKLLALAKVDVQFQEAAEALKAGRPEVPLAIL